MIMIKQGASGDNTDDGRRIAKAWDEKLAMPAIRIVYHTDDTIAKSTEQYHQQVANDQGYDRGPDRGALLIGGLVAVVVLGVGFKLFGGKRQKTGVKGGITDSSIYEDPNTFEVEMVGNPLEAAESEGETL